MNTKNVKVTMKNSKQEMLRFLEAVLNDTLRKSNKDLSVRVESVLDNNTSAKKADVFKVVDEVQNYLLGEPVKSAPVENEVKKPKLSASKKKDTKDSEKTKPEASKKAEPKEVKTSEPKVIEAPVLSENSMPLAMVFPKELTVPNLGKLRAVPETSMDDLAKAMTEDGRHFYFACYWTPRMIKEYFYAEAREVNKVKSFPNDLDILEPVYFCDGIKRMWANSVYTEAMFRFNEDSLEHIVEKNPYNGEQFRIRVSSGMEFELYELIEEDTTK